ncbi:uncharacterized protein LAESUDRAFT_759395 [Laetiporus sulphureus 93-53]|uniref:Phospholipid/glycerol acyltransferase domain-containing protein n=1 Tax=Laetiporus sulphureus 93-53 TaxID=1314785 RepID=A0A165EA84_9APHY|nr:uncharacterized protein LAESUDRAFT_759395 [Laetiporus sulphureus 93-53]KZT06577.1 hypothetical protein LAESUDRAFT_759395 [Laetiporus sulphureus 93-53]
MMIDPAILSTMFPYHRILHFWAKASLFMNPIADYVLHSAGNISVDCKAKDCKKLFLSTFDVLSHRHAIIIFLEGTSYTKLHIVQVKNGTAWAALEYAKDTLYAARMARDLLWDNEKSINLDEFIIISQPLVDLFSTPDLVLNFYSDSTASTHILLTTPIYPPH